MIKFIWSTPAVKNKQLELFKEKNITLKEKVETGRSVWNMPTTRAPLRNIIAYGSLKEKAKDTWLHLFNKEFGNTSHIVWEVKPRFKVSKEGVWRVRGRFYAW